MMLAGLIKDVTTQDLKGTPGLKSLPVLGALFSSRDYQKEPDRTRGHRHALYRQSRAAASSLPHRSTATMRQPTCSRSSSAGSTGSMARPATGRRASITAMSATSSTERSTDMTHQQSFTGDDPFRFMLLLCPAGSRCSGGLLAGFRERMTMSMFRLTAKSASRSRSWTGR